MLTFLLLKSVRGIKVPPNEKDRGHNPELPMCLIESNFRGVVLSAGSVPTAVPFNVADQNNCNLR